LHGYPNAHTGYTGRPRIDATYSEAGLVPDVVISALDADVIKTYVEVGLGVGIIASMAFDAARDVGLTSLDASHLFPPNTTRIAGVATVCAATPTAFSRSARPRRPPRS
jgi:LysR family cys regulon transcriptional activator